MISTGTGRLGYQRTNGDYPDYNIVEIGKYIEKCPRDLKTPAVTQTPVENHQFTLVWNTHINNLFYVGDLKLFAYKIMI